tara:strand:- start:822 stop:932 length:111 start_codon:yes stop_codon:yes gene_type:complete
VQTATKAKPVEITIQPGAAEKELVVGGEDTEVAGNG